MEDNTELSATLPAWTPWPFLLSWVKDEQKIKTTTLPRARHTSCSYMKFLDATLHVTACVYPLAQTRMEVIYCTWTLSYRVGMVQKSFGQSSSAVLHARKKNNIECTLAYVNCRRSSCINSIDALWRGRTWYWVVLHCMHIYLITYLKYIMVK